MADILSTSPRFIMLPRFSHRTNPCGGSALLIFQLDAAASHPLPKEGTCYTLLPSKQVRQTSCKPSFATPCSKTASPRRVRGSIIKGSLDAQKLDLSDIFRCNVMRVEPKGHRSSYTTKQVPQLEIYHVAITARTVHL